MTTTTVFAEANDGRLFGRSSTSYANARNGTDFIDGPGAGGTQDFETGQSLVSGTWRCKLAFLSFDTSSIPDTDTIDSVTLYVRGSEANTTNNPVIQVRAYDWGTTIEAADFRTGDQFAALDLLATFDTAGGWSTVGYNTFSENGTAFRSAINKTGFTRIVCSTDRFAAGTAPGSGDREDPRGWSSEATGTTSDPKLVIEHSAGGAPTAFTGWGVAI